MTHPPGRVSLPTRPGWDQLVFARSGVFTAHTGSRSWLIPALRALCVPDGTAVRIETTRRVQIRCLYAVADLGLVGDAIRVVNLGPLTRELLHHAVEAAPMDLGDRVGSALVTLLADQLARQPDAPLQLPRPSDPTADALATAILEAPAQSLEVQLRKAAASRRTLERRFKAETRMTIGQWHRRARVLSAVAMLADGQSVTSVGLEVGYASVSSFIAAFRSELGSPPREFMRIN